MFLRSSRLFLSVVIGLMALCGSGRAGVLAGLPAIYGPGTSLGVPTGETVNVNNDNVGVGNPNLISLVGIDIRGLDPIDITIPIANSPGSSGTTEYFLMLGTAANMTQSAWSGFEIELGSGISDEFLRLAAGAIPGVNGLDFDTPNRDPAVSSTTFPTITHGAQLLSFRGGIVPVGGVASAQNFSIDIPDTASASATYNFTIRLRPVPVLGGDFDQDGDVDGPDFLAWQRNQSLGPLADWQINYGESGFSQPGDFDGDGDVDGTDFLIWQRNPSVGVLSDWQANYGHITSVSSTSVAVPEPIGLLLLVEVVALGCVSVGDRRRAIARIASATHATCGNR
jgi:hypothetical protein